MSVTEGMDVERVRSIAQQMIGLSTKVDDVRSSGQGQVARLKGVWAGPDLEQFEDRWHNVLPRVHDAGQAMREFGRLLRAQADDQEETSKDGGSRQRTRPPHTPPPQPPGRCEPGNSLLDRILDRIGDTIEKVWKGFESAVDWFKDKIWTPFSNISIVADIVEGLRKVSDEFKKWTDDLLRQGKKILDGVGSAIEKWAPKLLKWGEQAMPFIKGLGKFGKIIPGVGVAFWAWDMKDLAVDWWNGEINPHDFWNKGVLGTASMVAGFFPGPGTLISGLLAAEQLRHQYMPQLDGWVADQLGIEQKYVTWTRVAATAPVSPLALADLLPNKHYDLPGPSPKEQVQAVWDGIRDAGDPFCDLNPLPWP